MASLGLKLPASRAGATQFARRVIGQIHERLQVLDSARQRRLRRILLGALTPYKADFQSEYCCDLV